MRNRALPAAAYPGVALLSCLMASAPVFAQTTVNLSSLYLSPGAEVDLGLYGAGGGQSDRINIANQFNYSSAGTFTFALSHEDMTSLIPGSTFTLVTFGSTNFTDGSSFRVSPRGTVTALQGDFTLVPADSGSGTPGSLLFTLHSLSELPEPSAGTFLALGLPGAIPLFARSLRGRNIRLPGR